MNDEISKIQQECIKDVLAILDRTETMQSRWKVKQILTQEEIMLATDGLCIFANECYRVAIDAENAIVSDKALVLDDKVSSMYKDNNEEPLPPLIVYSFANTLYNIMQDIADNFEVLYFKIVAGAYEVKSLSGKITLAVVQRVASVIISERENVRENVTETTTA